MSGRELPGPPVAVNDADCGAHLSPMGALSIVSSSLFLFSRVAPAVEATFYAPPADSGLDTGAR